MGENRHRENIFRFKRFSVVNRLAAMKVGTDGVLLGAWTDITGAGLILDAGTGSGLIALMLAQRAPHALIDAIDIVDDAVAEAAANIAASPWADRITACRADLLAYRPETRYDLIVSNPPFFNTTLRSPDDARALARHGDGLSFESLIAAAPPLLAADGRLAFISPADREDDIVCAAAMARMHVTRLTRVYTRLRAPSPTRLLWQLDMRPAPLVTASLRVGDSCYQALTGPFYLDRKPEAP